MGVIPIEKDVERDDSELRRKRIGEIVETVLFVIAIIVFEVKIKSCCLDCC